MPYQCIYEGDPKKFLLFEIEERHETKKGTYARFEFTRYDQKKPGILGKPGPFPDEAVAGLIAGNMSRLYPECFASEKTA